MIENLMQLSASSIFTRLGWTLLHSFWLLALLGLGIIALLSLMRNYSANFRYTFGYLGLCSMLATPVVVFFWLGAVPRQNADLAAGEQVAVAVHDNSTVQASFPDASEEGSSTVSTPILELEEPEATSTSNPIIYGLVPWLSFGWFAGIAFFTAWHLGGWWTAWRMCKIGTFPIPAGLTSTIRELKSKLKVKTDLSVFGSSVASVPVVIGWLRPTILIPLKLMEQLSGVQLRIVIAHELAHVRRHDYLANLIQTTIDTFLFFHPMAWRVSNQVRVERENCCDDLAVERCGERIDLASALVAIESARIGPTPSSVVAASGGNTGDRVYRLLGASKPRRQSRSLPIFSIGALILFAILSFQPGSTSANMTDEDGKWGPVQSGLQMRLTVENRTGADENIHRITVEIANRRDSPVSFRIPLDSNGGGNWLDYLRRNSEFECGSSTPREYFQMAATTGLASNTLPSIDPGESVKVSWVETGITLGNAQGYPRFNRSGTYVVAAKLKLLLTDGKEIKLSSNHQDYVIASSQRKPLRGVGKLTDVSLKKNTATIDVGRNDGLRVGDQFSRVQLGTNWKFTIVKAFDNHSAVKFDAVVGQPRENSIIPIDIPRLSVKHNRKTTQWSYIEKGISLGLRNVRAKMPFGEPVSFTLCWRNFGTQPENVPTLAPINCSRGFWWIEFRRIRAEGKTDSYYAKAPRREGNPISAKLASQKTLVMPMVIDNGWTFETKEKTGLKRLPPGKYEFWVIGYDEPIELSSPLANQPRPYSRMAVRGNFEITN